MPPKTIESLYNVFSRHGCPSRLEGCPCCTSPAEAQPLVAKQLRLLTAPELEHYAFKALTTWGTLDDYKYFLPRILELTEDGSLLCDVEVTLRKLDYGGFCDWSPDERLAVHGCVFGVWREAVGALDTDRADAWLCGAAPALADVAAFLDYADAAAPDFKAAYAANHSDQTKRTLLNSFWDRSTPSYQQVLTWLYPKATSIA